MDLRQLKYFVVVFEHGNMSRAAEEIPISQPALTRSVRMLEDELGVELFERHARGAAPTAAGERFYHHAKSILAECARARADALQAGGVLSGEVSIGVAPLFAPQLIDSVVKRFSLKHEAVAVTMLLGVFEDLVNKIELGQIELALCSFPVQEMPASIVFEPLFQVQSNFYTSSSHPGAGTPQLTGQSLAEARWINMNQSHSQELIDSLFITQGFTSPRMSLKTNSVSLMGSMIEKYGFVGLMPDHVMEPAYKAGKVIKLEWPETPIVREAGLIMRKDGYRRPVAELLAEEIRAACREIFS